MARRALGPATLAVTQAVDALAPAPWLVASSGGADSLALAWAAHHVATRRGTPVRALVVDHGLQPNSDAVAARVVEVLSGLGLGAEVVWFAVVDAGAGPEASARDARYAALEAARRPDERILLGHTLDDQAETVLLRLARGAGAHGADPPQRGQARSYSGAILPYTPPLHTRQRPPYKRKNQILPVTLGSAA